QEAEVVDALVAARREKARLRARNEAGMAQALRVFGLDKAGKVCGLLQLDLSALLPADLLPAVGGPTGARSGAASLPARFSGFLDVQAGRDGNGTVLRLQLLGSR